jgi:hypothetical protein
VVEFWGNVAIGVKVLTRVAVLVRDGVWGGVNGWVSLGVRVPGGVVVEFWGSVVIGVKVVIGV